ncbi:MAG TPA: Gfo/Idh/MocA family oxidoreductase [Chloroflexota bacterium]|nr:Gfo/Idh/MocA family oxidoreductase [Chloroflexota bacterium]
MTESAGRTGTTSLPVGLTGCGTMGSSHARQMAALGELHLAGACDVDEERARQTAAAAGGEVFVTTDVSALLGRAEIPAVLVATPNFIHREVVLQAIAAGKDVFCEKPMALSLADCEEMIDAARRAGRKLMVGQVLRLITVFATVRRLVEEGLIGPPRAMRILRCSRRSDRAEGPWRTSWRRSRANTGGLLFEINVHEFDFMRAILGEAAEVSAMAANIAHPEQDYEDHAVVTVRFRNGAIAFLETSTATALGATEGLITGEQGSIAYDWGRNSISYRLTASGPDGEPVPVPVERDEGRSVQSELLSFARWVLYDEPPLVSAEDGRRAVQLAEAAYRSALERRAIAID